MISLLVKPEDLPVAEEFFELFKTGWDVYQKDRPCTILLTDQQPVGDPPKCALTIVYADAETPTDTPHLVSQPDGTTWPLYGNMQTFPQWTATPLLTDESSGQTIAYMREHGEKRIIHIGFNLFAEIKHLLTIGQPVEFAQYPTLDRHISFLRQLILQAGLPVVEIPPCPKNATFFTCLTHDVDFVRITDYGFSKTVLGFLYRATAGSIRRFLTQRLSFRNALRNFGATFSLPLVYLGLRKDFWMQFDTYRMLENKYRSTFFMIPFKNQPGQQVNVDHPERRATQYDVTDVPQEVQNMEQDGWEFGLHGIDAWRDPEAAITEKERIISVTGQQRIGTRMHWLCNQIDSPKVLEQAGFDYDATCGYNETIGFRAGTSQVFKPLNCKRLLEVPLHIQDVAMFYPAFLDLNLANAWKASMSIANHQKNHGGVFTLLWHMRSTAPERLWGKFYQKLLNNCSDNNSKIGTVQSAVDWFRQRRSVKLHCSLISDNQISINLEDRVVFQPDMRIRIYHPGTTPHTFTDLPWQGEREIRTSFQPAPFCEDNSA